MKTTRSSFFPVRQSVWGWNLCSLDALLLSFMSTPFITPYLIGSIYQPITLLLIAGLFIPVIRYPRLSLDAWDKLIMVLMGITLLHAGLIFVAYIDQNGFAGFRADLGLFMKYLMLIPFGWLLKHNYRYTLNAFWYTNLVIILLAILLFFLLLGGIPLPQIEFSPDGRPHYFFWIGASNMMVEFGSHLFIRTAGFTDEPGRLALILSFMIVLNEFTYKKNSYRILFLISGFFTFSMAFFVTLFPVVVYWIKVKIITLRTTIKTLILSLAVLGAIGFSLPDELKDNASEAFYYWVLYRFETDGSGRLKGDNRSDKLDHHLAALAKYPLLGINGVPDSEYKKYLLDHPTFIGNMARNGILFDFIYYTPVLFLLLQFGRSPRRWLFFCLGLNFLQRPGLDSMFFLMICSFIYYHKNFELNENSDSSYLLQSKGKDASLSGNDKFLGQ